MTHFGSLLGRCFCISNLLKRIIITRWAADTFISGCITLKATSSGRIHLIIIKTSTTPIWFDRVCALIVPKSPDFLGKSRMQGAHKQTRTVHLLLDCVRGAHIVASLTLLAIPDALPRCFAHRARSASVPQDAAKDEPPSMFFEHRWSLWFTCKIKNTK